MNGDKFCNKCGNKVDVINESTDNSTVINENEYTEVKRESVMSISMKVIGVTLICEFFALGDGLISAVAPILGLGLAALIISWFIRPYIGDCPYCGSKVKTYNNAGFICPRCRKNVAVKDNKFLKIKN